MAYNKTFIRFFKLEWLNIPIYGLNGILPVNIAMAGVLNQWGDLSPLPEGVS
jgi:hypothetical protein